MTDWAGWWQKAFEGGRAVCQASEVDRERAHMAQNWTRLPLEGSSLQVHEDGHLSGRGAWASSLGGAHQGEV